MQTTNHHCITGGDKGFQVGLMVNLMAVLDILSMAVNRLNAFLSTNTFSIASLECSSLCSSSLLRLSAISSVSFSR
jgi:hypothetical protein